MVLFYLQTAWRVGFSFHRGKKQDNKETKASGTEQTYPVIDFHIKLRRKPAYYITGVILPVILVAFLQILVFILPVDSKRSDLQKQSCWL